MLDFRRLVGGKWFPGGFGIYNMSIFLEFQIFNIAILYGLISYSRNKGLATGNENISYMFFLVLIVWAIFGLFGNGEYAKVLWLTNGASLGIINAPPFRTVNLNS